MAERRAMVLQTSADAKAHRQLNRQIWKSLRHDIRNFNVNMVKEAIERNQGSKVFARDVSIGQSQLTKLKAEDGSVASTKAEVLGEIETFYGQLYASVTKPVSSVADPRARLTRHYTEDIPDISLYEIRMALKQLKNNKAPDYWPIIKRRVHIQLSGDVDPVRSARRIHSHLKEPSDQHRWGTVGLMPDAEPRKP
ncbi:uncharacterized protein LOC111349058 [Spodoptera litura]|uniref:Uncharacterized protein LOC111349058 n=1 Tax=Spodoptera litura TaxID=69820 RepID=A0A9J7DRN2_SPOLT|nr:uncharacterized protein LOC111349058 [Spodoptera litura]